MKTFKIEDRKVIATHLWKTHPFRPGAARFHWVFVLCELISVNGDMAIIRKVGLKSRPKKEVPYKELIDIDTVDTRSIPISI